MMKREEDGTMTMMMPPERQETFDLQMPTHSAHFFLENTGGWPIGCVVAVVVALVERQLKCNNGVQAVPLPKTIKVISILLPTLQHHHGTDATASSLLFL